MAEDLATWTALGFKNTELFSVLPVTLKPFPAWGASQLYGLLYPWFGLEGLVLLHVIPFLITLRLIYRFSIEKNAFKNSLGFRALLYVSWLGFIPLFLERPAGLVLPLLALSFLIISSIRTAREKNKLLKLCAIQILWVNLHGSWPLLILMLAYRLIALSIRKREATFLERAAVWVVLAGLSTLLNPFGWKIIGHVFETARVSSTRGISEWGPVGFSTDPVSGLLYLVLCAGFLFFVFLFLFLLKAKKSPRLLRKARGLYCSPIILLLFVGSTAIRNTALPWFFVPVIGALFFGRELKSSPSPSQARGQRTVVNAIVSITLIVFFILLLPAYKPAIARFLPEKHRAAFGSETPLRLIEVLKQKRQKCPIASEIEISGIIMLELENPVFLDTRNIIYDSASFDRFQEFLRGDPNWENYLAQYRACLVMIQPKRHPDLYDKLKKSLNWRFIDEEAGVVLFEKTSDR